MTDLYKRIGVKIPEILLPKCGTDLTKWSVVACDQYTSQPEYWEEVMREVGQNPSTLKLTFPEIYLKDDDSDARIAGINETMDKYLNDGILEPMGPGFILVERETPHNAARKGLMLALDLECYDYRPGSQTLIRTTEGTVLDRIPPRVKIRENAPIELPHIMVLIDDPEKTVIETLYARKDSYKKLYDFELMQGGGRIRGWKIDDGESLTTVARALASLAGETGGRFSSSSFLFAVGDGNHSLASAKAHWENVKAALMKKAGGSADLTVIPEHPARYALVEVVNVHDEGIAFEPIHRVLFGVNGTEVLEQLKSICTRELEYNFFDSKSAMEKALSVHDRSDPSDNKKAHNIPFILEGIYGLITVHDPVGSLEVGTLQSILDDLAGNDGKSENGSVSEKEKIEIDYIHGEEVVTELGSQNGCMGFYLPVMDKHDLFKTVTLDGVLPRKTFSMGEAREKRYYLECRCIR